MENSKVAIFWTDENTHSWLLSELWEGRLRQGWGAPGMQLTEDGTTLSMSRWVDQFTVAAQKVWNWNPSLDASKTRYTILARMTRLQKNDLVVIPRMPRKEEFTIAQVTDGYQFDECHLQRVQDFGHVVLVDKRSLKSYSYSQSREAAMIAAKFQSYRSAVNNVANETYAEVVRSLYKVPS